MGSGRSGRAPPAPMNPALSMIFPFLAQSRKKAHVNPRQVDDAFHRLAAVLAVKADRAGKVQPLQGRNHRRPIDKALPHTHDAGSGITLLRDAQGPLVDQILQSEQTQVRAHDV